MTEEAKIVLMKIMELTINALIDNKYQLEEDFANGLIDYAEYEECKCIVDNRLDGINSRIQSL